MFVVLSGYIGKDWEISQNKLYGPFQTEELARQFRERYGDEYDIIVELTPPSEVVNIPTS